MQYGVVKVQSDDGLSLEVADVLRPEADGPGEEVDPAENAAQHRQEGAVADANAHKGELIARREIRKSRD